MSGIVSSAGSKSGVIGTTELEIEEGEYIALFNGDDGSVTAGSQDTLQYTKHGTVVHIHGGIEFTSGGTASSLSVTLPFTARTSTENSDIYAGGAGSYNSPFNSRTQLIYRINGGQAYFILVGCGDNQTYASAPPDNNSEYFFDITYLTDA